MMPGPMMVEHLRSGLILSPGEPTIFLRRPISLTILIVSVVALVAALLPAILAKREEAFQE
jgi:putative tricarboxylic transport membrane protein